MEQICITIAYYVALITVISFSAKLGVAKAFNNLERKKALWKNALAFALGLLVGGLFGLGI